MKRVRLVAAALLAALCVVLVPSTGWASDPNGAITGSVGCGYAWGGASVTTVPANCSTTDTSKRNTVFTIDRAAAGLPLDIPIYYTPHAHPGLTNFGGSYSDTFSVDRQSTVWATHPEWFPAGQPIQLDVVYYAGSPATLRQTNAGLSFPVFGQTMTPPAPPPKTPSTCTPSKFRHVDKSVSAGAVSMSWAWSGALPPAGWKVTDADAWAAVGAGATLATAPKTELTVGLGRYGFAGLTLASTVSSLRVASTADPGCFIGYAVVRDGAGVVTGLTASGDFPPDENLPAPVTDDTGADCGSWDIPCVLKALFVPHPSSWGLGALVDGASARPPFSFVGQAWTATSSAASVYSVSSSACGNLPNFGLKPGFADGVQGNGSHEFSCGPNASMSVLRGVVQAALIILTCIYLVKIVAGGVNAE
jgi:hypothetical protein